MLSCFEQACSINVDDGGSDFSQALSYHLGSFPMKYTEVPLHHNKEDNLLKRAIEWRGKLLSHAARLELVRSTLASIPLYLLSVIKFPKWVIKLINSHMSHCLWGTI
jgi:hypothetical protein